MEKSIRSIFTTAAAILLCSGAEILTDATVYYVSQAGNDSNSGTDSTLPWLHCPGMSGWSGVKTLNAGDTVYFRNTDTWEAAAGQSMVQVTGGVTYDGRSWGSGSRATLKAQGAFNRAVINCMEDDQTYPTVLCGFNVDANHFVTSGVTFNWPHADRNLTGALKKVEDCEVQNVWSEQAKGQYEYGILSGGWGGFHIANFEILDCDVHHISRGGINNYMGNDIPGNRSDNVLIRGNTICSTGTDPDYSGSAIAIKNHTVNTIVEYNYMHDIVNGTGIGLDVHPEDGFIGPENAIIRHNIVADIPHCGIYLGSPGVQSYDIYGNIFMRCSYEAIRVSGQMEGTVRLRIINNTFFQNFPGDWSQQVRIASSSAFFEILEVKNNIFYCPSGTSSRALLDDEGSIRAHSNNLYYHPENRTLVICDGVSYNAQTISSWEPTSVTGDPGFKDTSMVPAGFSGQYGHDLVPAPDGLSLSITGAAINSGADLGNTFAGAINLSGIGPQRFRPRGHAWDIGAYQSEIMSKVHFFPAKMSAGKKLVSQTESKPAVFTIDGRLYKNRTSINPPNPLIDKKGKKILLSPVLRKEKR